jgi:hypothetical protein
LRKGSADGEAEVKLRPASQTLNAKNAAAFLSDRLGKLHCGTVVIVTGSYGPHTPLAPPQNPAATSYITGSKLRHSALMLRLRLRI